MSQYIQVLTILERKEDAEKIAEDLVGKRLAGCVQIIGPIRSTYWWKGDVKKAEEWLCLVKSRKDLYGALEKAIEKIHPYETPEIICTPISKGSEKYLDWLENELKGN